MMVRAESQNFKRDLYDLILFGRSNQKEKIRFWGLCIQWPNCLIRCIDEEELREEQTEIFLSQVLRLFQCSTIPGAWGCYVTQEVH